MVARKKTTHKKKTKAKKKPASKRTGKKKTVRRSTAKRSTAKKASAKKTKGRKKTTARKSTAKKARAKKKVKKKTAARKKAARKKVKKKKKVSSHKKAARKAKKKPVAAKKIKAQKTSPTTAKAEIKTPPKAVEKMKKLDRKTAARLAGRSNLLSLKSKTFRRSSTDVQPFTPYLAARGEEFMNADQSEHFRQILLDWKRLLMEEVDRTVHHMQDEAANFPDPNDRATQEEEFALELRTRDRERKLIRKIDEAMLRLETGDYGYCEICGVEIGIKRLEARPTATLCIDCKTLDEIKEKQLG
jgi:DnaK suppressor protein